MANHRRASSLNPITREDNAMFLDILQEPPLESKYLIGSYIYLIILACYAGLAAGSPWILQPIQPFISSLLCTSNVSLLILTSMFQQYFVNHVRKIRLQGYYSFSRKLEHVVRLPFAIMSYGTASMLLFMVWRPYVDVVPVLSVQRFIISTEAISAASFMIVLVGYVRQYNSVNSQPDVSNSLYSPLQPNALEGVSNAPQVDLVHLVATRDQELRTLSSEVDQLHLEFNLARYLISERDTKIQHVRNTNNHYAAENERLRAILGEWSLRAAKLERALEVERKSNLDLRKKVLTPKEQRQVML